MSIAPPDAGDKNLSIPSYRGFRVRLDPQVSPEAAADKSQVSALLHSMPRPWAIDLFSGAGGMSFGLANAGFSIVAAADHDATALETHAYNLRGLTWHGDLTDSSAFIEALTAWGIQDVDLVAGGPPCQPFSRAGASKIAHLVRTGRRIPNDRRSDLWRSFLQVIDHLDPKAVLIENVPDFARKQNGASLVALLSELNDRGFETSVKILQSWHFGVPQHRARLFVVGVSQGVRFDWPSTNASQTTLRDAISDLPVVGGGQRLEELSYSGNPLSDFGKRMRQGLARSESATIRDHVTRFVREDDAAIFEVMGPGQKYKDVPKRLRRYRADIFNDKYHRLTWDGLSRSITAHIAKDGYWYIHPSQNRTLSIREAARIQTFPDSFRFAGFPTNRYRQIGNAVPPLLAEAVGSSMLSSLATQAVQGSSPRYPDTSIRNKLADWFADNRRNYEWRRCNDPWSILLAESCLHRTRADQVSGVFPSLRRLALSPEELLSHREQVETLLWHLGLNWRAEMLFKLAEDLIENHGGMVPDSYSELLNLPGIGDYIASAVLCFAFGQPAALVDTNTARIMRRITGDRDDPVWKLRLRSYELSLPDGPDSIWNYSLLDLGAAVCKSSGPACEVCPIVGHCATGKGRVRHLGA